MKMLDVPVRSVAFDLTVGYLEELDVPLVGVGISHPDPDSNELVPAHSFVLHAPDAANLGVSLIRLSAGSVFYAALDNYAAMKEENGDGVAAQEIRDFKAWFERVGAARAEDSADADMARMGVRRKARPDG